MISDISYRHISYHEYLSAHNLNIMYKIKVTSCSTKYGEATLSTSSLINFLMCRYNAVDFLQNPYKIHPYSLPVNARYGVSFVCSNPDLCLASVTVVVYPIRCYIWPCYNAIRLYNESINVNLSLVFSRHADDERICLNCLIRGGTLTYMLLGRVSSQWVTLIIYIYIYIYTHIYICIYKYGEQWVTLI